jgi:flagellar biosynthesis chaperone FliJ
VATHQQPFASRRKKKASINRLVSKEGNMASGPSEISETFNEYFSNIARNLKSKISVHEDSRSYEAFLNDPVPLTIFLKLADNSEVPIKLKI